MQNNWGRLFDGASIDIYEWTRSPALPEKWREGKTYRIPKMEYHRVIKGTNKLVLKIKEYSDDNI